MPMRQPDFKIHLTQKHYMEEIKIALIDSADFLARLKAEIGYFAKKLKETLFLSTESDMRSSVAILHDDLRHLNVEMKRALSKDSNLSQEEKEILETEFKQQLFPYFMSSGLGFQILSKPRGYAGDFQTIQMLYDDKNLGHREFGKVVDRLLRQTSPAAAVRNRRHFFKDEIVRLVATQRNTNVTCLSSGPATEVLDASELVPKGRSGSLTVNLVDFDDVALQFVSNQQEDRLHERHDFNLNYINKNIVKLIVNRKKKDQLISNQDLVYSIGVTDYLNDKTVVALLDYIHKILRPGGRVIIGNFHPRNNYTPLMELLLDWRLIHRTEEDMKRIFGQSKFGACTDISFEPEGINMFAQGIKE
eukprot:CAMPEP_0114514804 /NCGR_PEP_ID=MMETSP0109-20121206/16362_1 /TAXON_ID=29199 /ORGANISM="Chlorarachnion reptans, Strain CCCM449" /LENGTH=360 /DNA_ID=CAMNT_0001694895 /DNA_START=517 /DNA_END=1599 /DNA_ORIENTATION=-